MQTLSLHKRMNVFTKLVPIVWRDQRHESEQVSSGRWEENQERSRIWNRCSTNWACQGTMWTHGIPQEEDWRKQEFNDIYPKFFTVSPTLLYYIEIPFPKSSRWEMFPEKQMGLSGYSDLTQLDYPIHCIVPTANAFRCLQGHRNPCDSGHSPGD